MALNRNKIRILIFGHKEFSQLLSSVLAEFTEQADCRIIDAIIGTIDEANAHINLFFPDIVISAGSNAAYLQTALTVPVISMNVTESDIISAVNKAAKVSSDIHMITYDDYSRLTKLLNASTSLTITHSKYDTAAEAKQAYHLSKLKPGQAVVGASLVCGLAEQDGLKAFLIYSKESCRALLTNAIHVGQQQKNDIHFKAMRRWLFKDSKTPVLIIDNKTNVLTANVAAINNLALTQVNSGHTDIDISMEEMTQINSSNQQSLIAILHGNQFSGLTDGKCRLNNSDWFFHKDTLDVANHHFEVYQFYAQNPSIGRSKSNKRSYFAQTNNLVFSSPSMSRLIERTDLYAQSPSHVLIIGESGTGKEMIAHRIHQQSKNSEGEFVAINCAAMPSELFEGELFGYVEGAFTGSKRGGKHGLLYEAEGGALFLDEIGELSLPLQAKLLRVIQEKSYRPIGSHKEFPVNLKIIAATNKPLAEQVASGLFRNDLYYRLNVLSLNVPALKDRKDDVGLITRAKLSDLNFNELSADTLDDLSKQLAPIFDAYHWPGNIRELENIVERLLVYCSKAKDASKVSVSQLLSELAPELFHLPSNQQGGALVENEIQLVNHAMTKFNGNKELVAQFLGISQTTLWRRLKRINNINQRGQHHA